MVKTLSSNVGGAGSIPGQGTKTYVGRGPENKDTLM